MGSKPLPSTQQRLSSVHSISPQTPPATAYFDSQTQTWVISRFAEVQAAFLEPGLCPVGANRRHQVTAKDREDQARIRGETVDALTPDKLVQWESRFALQAVRIVSGLPTTRPIEVVEEFARPWALTVAVQVTSANEKDAAHLARLAAQVSASTANPDDLTLKEGAKKSVEDLDLALKEGPLPMASPAFVGLSQTLPCLLANVWHVLLEHPREFERLHDSPELIPRALEELLRLAGFVNELHRQAIEDADVNGIILKAGERLRLLVGAAHRDGQQFTSPEELDVTRRNVRHFTFGAGPHSCAAAPLLRMLLAVATRCLVAHFTTTETPAPVNWFGGSVFRWPAPIHAVRR